MRAASAPSAQALLPHRPPQPSASVPQPPKRPLPAPARESALLSAATSYAVRGQPAATPAASSSGSAVTNGYGQPPPVPRYYADFTVYKSQSALSVSLVKPTWGATQGGNMRLVRAGALLLKFANALPNAPNVQQAAQTGAPRYNWAEAVQFALNPAEVGEFLAAPSAAHRFLHDPNKLNPELEGKEMKTLEVIPPQAGRTPASVAFRLSHKQQGKEPGSFFINLTPGELKVLEKIADHALMTLVGFDLMVYQDAGSMDAAAPASAEGYYASGGAESGAIAQ